MALFVLSDPHLAVANTAKSMEAFGPRWQDYMSRLEKNWRSVVKDEDTIILPGDISWAMTLSEALNDLTFLDRLPGQKLIGKGNHDFFWATASKMYRFFEQNGLHTLRILYNNAYLIENMIVCGTRGWFLEEKQQKTVGEVDYAKIVNRELIRLRMSLEAARVLQNEHGKTLEIVPFLHFPPVFGDFCCREFTDLLATYGVRRCYYGHIHTPVASNAPIVLDGISYILCAADHLRFCPLAVFATEKIHSME